MSPKERETLEKDILDILPEDHGYLLIALPIGVPSPPTYISNIEREDAITVMRSVLDVIDPTADPGLN